jgi:hypothetical protein
MAERGAMRSTAAIAYRLSVGGEAERRSALPELRNLPTIPGGGISPFAEGSHGNARGVPRPLETQATKTKIENSENKSI